MSVWSGVDRGERREWEKVKSKRVRLGRNRVNKETQQKAYFSHLTLISSGRPSGSSKSAGLIDLSSERECVCV